MGEGEQKKLTEVPQVKESGLSTDFKNEFVVFLTCFEAFEQKDFTVDLVLEQIRKWWVAHNQKLRHYGERFHGGQYRQPPFDEKDPAVVARVAQVDDLIDQANEILISVLNNPDNKKGGLATVRRLKFVGPIFLKIIAIIDQKWLSTGLSWQKAPNSI